MKFQLRPAVTLLVVLSLLTGLVYPLVVTGVAQALFADRANGSLIVREGRVVGSEWIGQAFSHPKYFWSRPSATGPMPYNAANSGGSNLGPSHPALAQAVQARIQALRAAASEAGIRADDPALLGPVPVDLVTASASGLDPHISRAAADYQALRVARVRGLPEGRVRELIVQHTELPLLGFLGEPRVHVLRLNLALDALRA
jgi:potassium-transporting ATPase KdpC subunit